MRDKRDKIEILLIEDSPSDVRLTEEALKDSGISYRLTVASDGEDGLALLHTSLKSGAESLPDVILLDLNMPRKNGHEVLSEIKDEPNLKAIPVILLTVSQQERDIMEALKLKMNYYICKPVAADKLATLLNAIFELHAESSLMPQGKSRPMSEDLHIRLVLASNPHTNPAVLTKLASEDNARVRCRIAENPHTPSEVLLTLSRDESPDVRMSVAENTKTPTSILEILAKDECEDVRLGLAENPNTPNAILQALASDDNVFVASTAAKTLSR